MNTFENLTLQQQRFCDEYLVSFNAYRAALNAGYSDNTARKAEILHLPQVQEYLKTGMNKTANRLQVTHDMILRELAKIAFSNMGNYYDETGAIKPMYAISDDDKAALSLYQIMDTVNEHGERIGELSRIKLHNKLSALDKIARHVGFYGANGGRKTEGGRLMTESGVLNEEPEAGSLKQEALEKRQEAGGKDQDLKSEILGEQFKELLVGTPTTGKVISTPGKTCDVIENILTLSPLMSEREELVGTPTSGKGTPTLGKESGAGDQELGVLSEVASYQPPMRIFENRNKGDKKRVAANSRGNYTFRKAGV